MRLLEIARSAGLFTKQLYMLLSYLLLLLLLLPTPRKGVFLQVAEASSSCFFQKSPIALKVLQKRQIALWENKIKNKHGQFYISLIYK
jgi:hypothetical protein